MVSGESLISHAGFRIVISVSAEEPMPSSFATLCGRVIFVIASQSMNAYGLMTLTSSGTVTSPDAAEASISTPLTETSGFFACCAASHGVSPNAGSEKSRQPSGISTLESEVQPENTRLPSFVSVLGSLTSVRAVQDANAAS